MPKKILKTEKVEGGQWHVRFRPASQFTRIRTPAWAGRVANSVSKDADVRMGRTEAGNWLVQSVLIEPPGVRGTGHARSLARRIQQKIEG